MKDKSKCIHGKKRVEWHCSRCKEAYERLRYNDGYIEALVDLEDWLNDRKFSFRLGLTEDEKALHKEEMDEIFGKNGKSEKEK